MTEQQLRVSIAHRISRRVRALVLPRQDMTVAQRRYDSLSSLPMFFVAIVWLVSSFFTWAPSLQPIYRSEGIRLSVITWAIFAIDFVIRFVLDPRKKSFLKRNWLFLIALIFPPLRIVLVVSAVYRVARDRNALTKMVGLYAVYGVIFVVIFGALFTLLFEIDAPGATITSFGDAVWWGFVTVTTVGYGDFTPVTVGGRVIAVMIMFTGAAAVGAVTAAVASRFITGGHSQSSQEPQTSPAQQETHEPSSAPQSALSVTQTDELVRQLDQLRNQIDALTAQLPQAATREGSGE